MCVCVCVCVCVCMCVCVQTPYHSCTNTIFVHYICLDSSKLQGTLHTPPPSVAVPILLGVRMRIMPRARHWKNSMNNHVILKGVDVEVMKVIQLASEVHN